MKIVLEKLIIREKRQLFKQFWTVASSFKMKWKIKFCFSNTASLSLELCEKLNGTTGTDDAILGYL